MNPEALIAAAMKAPNVPLLPSRGFVWAAALETDAGVIVAGCNVESASYGLSMCAERVAVFRGVADGFRCFKRVAVVTDSPTPTPPCGACRQLLWEFAPDAEVLLTNLSGLILRHTVRELLPLGFDVNNLSGV